MSKISGILLAGGKSERMGKTKSFLPYKNKTLIEYPLALLNELCEEVFIVTNSPELYSKFSAKILTDIYPHQGPMGGIYTGLKAAKNAWSLVLGCDMPLIRKTLLQGLITRANPSKDVILPTHKKSNGISLSETLCALYSKNCLSKFEEKIKYGEVSLYKTLPELNVENINYLDLDSEDLEGISFTNLNTPEELHLLGSRHS